MMEEGETRPGWTVIGLAKDWEFRSPAGRWEKVLRVDHDGDVYHSRIWTNCTGGFGWFLASSREIHAVPPRKTGGKELVIRLVDRGASSGMPARMMLIITTETASFAWSDWEDLPVYAEHLGRGLGWQLTHRPDGVGGLVVEAFGDKFGAKRRMHELARKFAHELQMAIGPEMGRN